LHVQPSRASNMKKKGAKEKGRRTYSIFTLISFSFSGCMKRSEADKGMMSTDRSPSFCLPHHLSSSSRSIILLYSPLPLDQWKKKVHITASLRGTSHPCRYLGCPLIMHWITQLGPECQRADFPPASSQVRVDAASARCTMVHYRHACSITYEAWSMRVDR